MSELIKIINISEIHIDDEWNSRGQFDKIEVAELAQDIERQTPISPETFGLISPVIVRRLEEPELSKIGKPYALVAGFRRTYAFKVLNREAIPAIIKTNMSAQQAAVMNLAENIQRKDLNILQEATAIKRLKDTGVPRDSIAKSLGVSLGWVQVRFNLLDLPVDVQQEAGKGNITQTHIKQLHSMKSDPEKMYEAVRKIKDHKERGNRAADLEIKKARTTAMTKRVRTRPEIFQMIEHLGKKIKFGLHTRTLAWAAGEITEIELQQDIKEFAEENGIDYEIPASGTIFTPDNAMVA